MTDEDRVVAGDGEASTSARDGSPYRCACRARPGVRPLLQRRRQSDALVPPALAVGPGVRARSSTAAFHDAWHRRVRARSTARSPTRSSPSSTTSPARRSSSTTTTCTSRRGSCASGETGRAARALRAHPVAAVGPGRVLPEPMRRAVHDGLLANDVVALPHAALARGTSTRSCEDARSGGAVHAHAASRTIRSRSTCAEFERAAGRATRFARQEATLPRPEKLIVRVDRTDPSKNIVRGFHAFALLLDAHPEWRGRVTMLALLDPSRQDDPRVRRVPGRDRARRRARSTTAFGAGGSTCRSRTTSRSRSRRTSSTTSCS